MYIIPFEGKSFTYYTPQRLHISKRHHLQDPQRPGFNQANHRSKDSVLSKMPSDFKTPPVLEGVKQLQEAWMTGQPTELSAM